MVPKSPACFNGMVQCANRPRGDAMLTWIVLGGSQLGHFAAASLIRSTYLCGVFSFVWKRNIERSSRGVNTEPSVCLTDYMPFSSLTGLAPVRYSFGPPTCDELGRLYRAFKCTMNPVPSVGVLTRWRCHPQRGNFPFSRVQQLLVWGSDKIRHGKGHVSNAVGARKM